ncbi:MAG: hypothetical protein U0174_16450 [Polyangiaceae bacterium]
MKRVPFLLSSAFAPHAQSAACALLVATLLLPTRADAAEPAAPTPAPAAPTSQNAAMADQLFQEGRTALQQNKFEEARSKFEASQRLDPAAGTQLNIAECLEKMNKFASATAMYVQAKEAASHRKRADWVQLATERIAFLAPKLARVRIVGTLPPSAKLELDGLPLERGEGETGIPVDRGPHRLVVIEGSRETFSTSFNAVDGATSTLTIDPPPPLRPVPAVAEPNAPPSKPVPPRPDGSDKAGEGHGPSPWTWVLAGASVGAFAVGGVLLGVRSGQVSKMNDVPCVPNIPLAQFNECRRLEGKVSSLVPPSIAMAAGGVFAVSAVVLYFTTSRSSQSATSKGPSCSPTLGGGTCSLSF